MLRPLLSAPLNESSAAVYVEPSRVKPKAIKVTRTASFLKLLPLSKRRSMTAPAKNRPIKIGMVAIQLMFTKPVYKVPMKLDRSDITPPAPSLAISYPVSLFSCTASKKRRNGLMKINALSTISKNASIEPANKKPASIRLPIATRFGFAWSVTVSIKPMLLSAAPNCEYSYTPRDA